MLGLQSACGHPTLINDITPWKIVRTIIWMTVEKKNWLWFNSNLLKSGGFAGKLPKMKTVKLQIGTVYAKYVLSMWRYIFKSGYSHNDILHSQLHLVKKYWLTVILFLATNQIISENFVQSQNLTLSRVTTTTYITSPNSDKKSFLQQNLLDVVGPLKLSTFGTSEKTFKDVLIFMQCILVHYICRVFVFHLLYGMIKLSLTTEWTSKGCREQWGNCADKHPTTEVTSKASREQWRVSADKRPLDGTGVEPKSGWAPLVTARSWGSCADPTFFYDSVAFQLNLLIGSEYHDGKSQCSLIACPACVRNHRQFEDTQQRPSMREWLESQLWSNWMYTIVNQLGRK